MSGEKKETKIHIDSDWKEEAQREKEILRQAEKREDVAKEPLPPASFLYFLMSLSTQAFMALGEVKQAGDESTEPTVDLEQAKFCIDLIEILQEKTEGNRTDDESQMMESLLYDLRMKYVAASK